jgi:hypothetical protein
MVLSSRLATNNASPAGVMAIAMGPRPVATLLPTCEAAPVVKFMLYEVTIWSPWVVTHMNPVVGVVMWFEVVQLFKMTANNQMNPASTKRDFMRIISSKV